MKKHTKSIETPSQMCLERQRDYTSRILLKPAKETVKKHGNYLEKQQIQRRIQYICHHLLLMIATQFIVVSRWQKASMTSLRLPIGQQLDARIPSSSSSPTKYLKKVEYPSLNTLPSTNPLEIENIIQSLNPVGGGTDMISTKILLVTYKKIINHLTYFFNICLRNAIFPNRLKTALVIPVYKTGENNKFTNYRPISMLPIFSKILEKILYTHISSYLEEYSILQNCQFGFRKNHSTYMAMALMVDIITKALEEREKVCGLYLDLKKSI